MSNGIMKMKMEKILLILLLPLALMSGCSHRGTQSESELYQRYAAQKDLKVAQINGFKLCDTVRVDVVMLQAENEQAWSRMKEEFDICGDEGTVSWLGEVDNPTKRTIWTGTSMMRVIASHSKHTIGFYRVDTEAQYDALIDYQLEKTKNKE